MCNNAVCGNACNIGYAMCGGACRLPANPNLSGYGTCATDCDCGATDNYYCAAGPFNCQTTVLATHPFSMNQTIAFTGNDGAWTRIAQAEVATSQQASRDVEIKFSYFTNSSVPSLMAIDIRLLVDGVQEAYIQGTATNRNGVFDVVVPFAAGGHVVDVEVRSRLMSGPPGPLQLWSGGYNNGAPTTLTATIVRKL